MYYILNINNNYLFTKYSLLSKLSEILNKNYTIQNWHWLLSSETINPCNIIHSYFQKHCDDYIFIKDDIFVFLEIHKNYWVNSIKSWIIKIQKLSSILIHLKNDWLTAIMKGLRKK